MSRDCDSSLLYFCSGQLWASTWAGRRWQKGPRDEWIGGESNLLRDGVAVQLTEEAAKDNIDELLHGQAMLLVKKLVRFIGYMS